MANPQKENGYTAIANELLEEILLSNFSKRELKIILFVIRSTYGFQKKSHDISVSFIAKGTGIARGDVNNTLKELIEKNVIQYEQSVKHSQMRELKINKDYESWLNCWHNTNSCQNTNSSVSGTLTVKPKTVSETLTKKEIINKEKYKEMDGYARAREIQSFVKDMDSEIINNIWIQTYGRLPRFPEYEETENLLNEFGFETVKREFRTAVIKNAKSMDYVLKRFEYIRQGKNPDEEIKRSYEERYKADSRKRNGLTTEEEDRNRLIELKQMFG